MTRSPLAALALTIASLGCPAGSSDQPKQAAEPPPELPRGPGVAVQGPPEALRARLVEAYALGMDRRFLRAVDEVIRLARGTACDGAASARRAGDGWTLTACGENVGTLPADPDLPDALALLVTVATRNLGASDAKITPPALPLPTADEALVRVARLERRAPPYARADVHELASSLVALAFALPDDMEVADVLWGRALAALAIDRALGGVDTSRGEALLGLALGYEAAARAGAARLPEGDPVRAFLERDDAALAEAATQRRHPPSAAVQLLWLRRLAVMDRDRAASYRPAQRTAPLGLALERARIGTFGVEATAGRGLVAAVLARDPGGIGGWRWKKGASFARLARVLARAGPSAQVFLRAAFFDGVGVQADFALKRRALAEEGEELLHDLGDATRGTPEEGLQRWLALRVAMARGSRDAADPLDAIAALPGLGGYPRLDLYGHVEKQLDHGDPALTAGRRRLTEWLDGRPRHRLWAAHLAAGGVQDPVLREETLRRAARLTGDTWSRCWVAKLDGEVAALRAIAGDARVGPALQAFAVRLLEREGGDDAEVERLYRSLLTDDRDDWSQRAELVRFLERRKRYGEAEGLVRAWLRNDDHPDDLRDASARTTLARLLSRQGKDEEAMKVMAPALRSWAFWALERGGILAARTGQEKPARALAAALEERYPGPRSAAARAAVLWQLHDHAGAAEVLAKLPPGRMLDWYDAIVPAFMDVLGDDPAAQDAFEALRRAKIDPVALAHVPGEMHARHRDDVAFAMASTLRSPDPIGDLELAVAAYGYLDASRGRPAARAWLEQRVPSPLRAPLSMFAFARGREELLWDLVGAPAGTTQNDDFVWLMFAAASLRVPPVGEHAAALAARFALDRPGFYHHVGRFLLGFEGPQRLMEAASPGKRACEAAYYLGLRAERNGDLATAADWYRASVENGTPKDGEYRWAAQRLGAWTSAERSLARLTAEARREAAGPSGGAGR
jgi:hypothetical protein